MMTTRRLAKLAPALVLVALALPSYASAQATRTWVSGVGDDANPCSRTAPCKTFAGAISKTAAGGEINAIDGGGFGAVTINKSLTIDVGGSWEGGILASNSNAINVAAGANDTVVLRGIDMHHPPVNPGVNGVSITSGKAVKIQHSIIHGFSQNGVSVKPTASTRVSVTDTRITTNIGN